MSTARTGDSSAQRNRRAWGNRHALAQVESGEMSYDDPDFVCAAPDLDHAAFLMRRMVDDAAWRTGLAQRGAQDIRAHFSRPRTAQCIASRLHELDVVKAE